MVTGMLKKNCLNPSNTYAKLILIQWNYIYLPCSIITGLPPTGSWQDLKDHMREAGDVCFADVYKDGTGACEYVRYEDMKYALKKLDDTKFKSHEVS